MKKRLKKTSRLTNKRIAALLILTTVIIVSSIFLYAGHFSSENRKNANQPVTPPASAKVEDTIPAVRYEHITKVIGGNRQEINLLQVDVSKPGVKIIPVLSFDLIYGFENLSVMASRKSAYAAVNGGFFYEYGLPLGMVAVDGHLIAGSTGKYPVFSVSGGKASLGEIKNSLWLDYGNGRVRIDRLNSPVKSGQASIYTPDYGGTSRVHSRNLTVTVRNGLVTDMSVYKDEVDIPEDGMLVTFQKNEYNTPDKLPFKKGDTVRLVTEPVLSPDIQAYECGNWLVKNGKIVVKDKDEWVGVMTNRDPRTAVGLKQDGTVILLTVDGRQPGFSAGLTGRELAEYLLELGAVNAAMLDGGASTEMIVNDKIVNRPSFKGKERPLAGGLVVIAP